MGPAQTVHAALHSAKLWHWMGEHVSLTGLEALANAGLLSATTTRAPAITINRFFMEYLLLRKKWVNNETHAAPLSTRYGLPKSLVNEVGDFR